MSAQAQRGSTVFRMIGVGIAAGLWCLFACAIYIGAAWLILHEIPLLLGGSGE
jgi:hypothetical protein